MKNHTPVTIKCGVGKIGQRIVINGFVLLKLPLPILFPLPLDAFGNVEQSREQMGRRDLHYTTEREGKR